MEEYLKNLKVVVLKRLCSAFGIPLKTKKADLINVLCNENFEICEISEQIELWEFEEQKEIEERELALKERERQRAHELELAHLEIERQRIVVNQTNPSNAACAVVQSERGYDLSKFLRPFKEDGDMGLFLVNFERVCTQMGFSRDTWSLRLITVLPGSAAEVIARLSEDDSKNYDKAKEGLLKRYKLTAEAFRAKFTRDRKTESEAFSDYAYRLKANFDQWVRSEEVENDFNKLAQLMCLEKFYSSISEEMRLWIEEKNSLKTLERAAELADEYQAKRSHRTESGFSGVRTQIRGRFGGQSGYKGNKSDKMGNGQSEKVTGPPKTNGDKLSPQNNGAIEKHFDKRRTIKCFNCKGPHYASQCDKPRVAWACLERGQVTDKLLEPYLIDAKINGNKGQVLRDSAATFDVVSEKWVSHDDYTGKTVYLRAALSDENVCLPVAKIKLEGTFGEVVTEAAVTKSLPPGYPYLLSNRTWENMKSQTSDDSHVILALTRSMARKLSDESGENKAEPEDNLELGSNYGKCPKHRPKFASQKRAELQSCLKNGKYQGRKIRLKTWKRGKKMI